MAAVLRLYVLMVIIVLVGACASRDEARQEHGLAPEEGSQIPEATPGVGIEKVQTRPNATPTPRPTSVMDKPLDPTGF